MQNLTRKYVKPKILQIKKKYKNKSGYKKLATKLKTIIIAIITDIELTKGLY